MGNEEEEEGEEREEEEDEDESVVVGTWEARVWVCGGLDFCFCLMMIETMMKILSSFHSKPNMMAAVLSWNWLLLMVPYGELI